MKSMKSSTAVAKGEFIEGAYLLLQGGAKAARSWVQVRVSALARPMVGSGALSLRVHDISAVRLYIPFEALAV
ncbi:hypothetical protein CUJ84_pRLN2000205 (plasmid) [Rhizobium leguminosarum]|uniref:Uncharacterized protein n=1 Tax=Rhizobium leguminosarum TaxID=384 RepID=A0A2K9ZEU0_RHILE|nr:hypothetical protein CUJ84_pRLN2000205 [Rhizobium leguminosarum]